MSEAAITAALMEENAAKCEPPLAENEVRTIAGSVSRYAPGVPASPVIAEEAYQTALRIFGLSDVPFAQLVNGSLIDAG